MSSMAAKQGEWELDPDGAHVKVVVIMKGEVSPCLDNSRHGSRGELYCMLFIQRYSFLLLVTTFQPWSFVCKNCQVNVHQ